MIIFVLVAILLIVQVLVYFLNKNRLKKLSDHINQEQEKLMIIPNFKKKSILIYVVSLFLTILIYIFPVTLNVFLYMHFPKEMFLGKLNLIYTFFLAFSAFLVADIIQNKIILSYVEEFKNKNQDIDSALLPNINLKSVFILDLLNIFTSLVSTVLVVALYIIL